MPPPEISCTTGDVLGDRPELEAVVSAGLKVGPTASG